MMKRFRDVLKDKDFIITAELFPPKGTNITKLIEKAEFVAEYVDAFNVTDSQRAIMRAGSMAICHKLKVMGFESIYQLTCRDRNRIALQSDLLSASVLGIENVLALSGDHPKNGDNPDALPVYDLDTVGLIRLIKGMNAGKDINGTILNGQPDFNIGAVVNPTADPLELQIMMMDKKISAGAEFFQTQIAFNPEKFKEFKDKISNRKVRVLFGVLLLKSFKMAENLNKVPGINISAAILKRLETAKNPLDEGIEITAELISEIKKFADGIHLMAINAEEHIPEILKRVK